MAQIEEVQGPHAPWCCSGIEKTYLLSIKRCAHLEHATAQAKGVGTARRRQIQSLLPVNTDPTGINGSPDHPILGP